MKRLLALALALIMAFTMLPFSAMASENTLAKEEPLQLEGTVFEGQSFAPAAEASDSENVLVGDASEKLESSISSGRADALASSSFAPENTLTGESPKKLEGSVEYYLDFNYQYTITEGHGGYVTVPSNDYRTIKFTAPSSGLYCVYTFIGDYIYDNYGNYLTKDFTIGVYDYRAKNVYSLFYDPDSGLTGSYFSASAGKDYYIVVANTLDISGSLTEEVYLEKLYSNNFDDVSITSNFCTPILWAAWTGVTTGKTPTYFNVNGACTRGQVVTFLWRAAGCPEPASYRNPFIDVPSNAFYYKAVLWAVSYGITSGTDALHFSPDAPCTRSQVVTFLWRAFGEPSPSSYYNPFVDVRSNAYYYGAVLWAVENDITAGTDAYHFQPTATCTRAQIVTFLFRALG